MLMAKNNGEFKYELKEFIGPIKENSENDWVKGVARIKWGDNPTTLDIRNMNLSKSLFNKGISLSDEEADNLVDILLDEGYGSIESIMEAIEKRKGICDYGNEKKDVVTISYEL